MSKVAACEFEDVCQENYGWVRDNGCGPIMTKDVLKCPLRRFAILVHNAGVGICSNAVTITLDFADGTNRRIRNILRRQQMTVPPSIRDYLKDKNPTQHQHQDWPQDPELEGRE